MKKLYFIFLLLPWWGLSSAYAQSVALIGEDFDNSEVTFSVTMSPATPTWVFVDYATYPHNPADMSRATFTSVLFDPSDAGTTLTTEKRGFWLERSATVTAKLEGVSGMFSWCAYAISAPPNAVLNPDGGYTLRGTPPFTVNGVELAESASTFGPACITSITDFTYNPDGFFPPPPEVTVTASETTVCAGAEVTFTATATGGTTTAMTYTWVIAGNTYTSTENTYPHALSTPGDATYTVRVINANGCTSTVSPAGTVTVNALPAVTAVSSSTVCYGTPATLSATASGATDPAIYTWSIESLSPKTTTTSTYTTPALTATATYTVQITNVTGCTSTVSDAGTITVPVPVFESAPTAPVCPNTEATFTVSGPGDGGLYCFTYECSECLRNPFLTGQEVPAAAHCLWDSNCEFGTAETYSVMMPDAGSMTVWVQAIDQYGCTSTASTIVEIIAVPTVFKVNSPTICYETTAALSATVSNTNESATYTWNIEGYSTTTTPTNTYTTPALTATVNYTVQLSNDTGCTSTVSAAGSIRVLEPFDAGSISSDTQTICKDAAVPAIGNAQGPSGGGGAGYYTYRWRHNGMEEINENTATFQPTAYRSMPGTHTFTREVYPGCEPGAWVQSANTWTLVVLDLPAMPEDPSSVVICAGNTATFSASVTAEATIDWYDAPTGGSTLSADTWSYTPEAPLMATTSYYAEARNTTTGCVSAERLQVTTTVNVVPTVTVSSASICYGSDATLTANATNATDPATYTWEINGAPETTINTNTYTMPASTEPITYTVQVTNDTGCTSTVSDAGTITWYDEFIPGAITTTAATICSGEVVTIAGITDASGGNTVIAYKWQHNNVDIGSATAPDYTPSGSYNTVAGAHTFTRWAKDGQCSDFIQSAGSYVLTVNPRPLTPVNASSVVICAGNTATFSASLSESDGVTIDWYDALTGGSTVCANSLSYTPDSPLTASTSYYAAARIIETGCLSTARLPVTTTVNPLPDIRVDGVPGSACVDDVLNVQASGAFAGGSYCFISYVNDVGSSDCEYDEANTFTVTVPNDGSMMIKVRAMTALGCVDSVLVHPPDMNSLDCIYSAGSISSNSVTAILGPYPPQTATNKPTSEEPAANQNATYEWRRTGTSSAILANSNTETYILTKDDDALYTAGTYYYSRWAFDDTPKNSVGLRAAGTYTLEVVAPPTSGAGTTTWYKEGSGIIWSGAVRVESCSPSRPTSPAGYTYLGACLYDNASQFCNGYWSAPPTSPCGLIDLVWVSNTSIGEGKWDQNTQAYQWGSAQFWVRRRTGVFNGCHSGDGWFQTYFVASATSSSCDVVVTRCVRSDRSVIRCVASYNY